MSSIFSELKRRHVFRVAAAYLITNTFLTFKVHFKFKGFGYRLSKSSKQHIKQNITHVSESRSPVAISKDRPSHDADLYLKRKFYISKTEIKQLVIIDNGRYTGLPQSFQPLAITASAEEVQCY